MTCCLPVVLNSILYVTILGLMFWFAFPLSVVGIMTSINVTVGGNLGGSHCIHWIAFMWDAVLTAEEVLF